MNIIKEFFGFGGYQREPEGYLSWQHLTFVSALVVIMIALAAVLGIRNQGHFHYRTHRQSTIVSLSDPDTKRHLQYPLKPYSFYRMLSEKIFYSYQK